MRVIYICVLLAQTVAAAAPRPLEVPPSLREWVPWVLSDEKDAVCPGVLASPESRVCYWPGRLELDFNPRSGRFAQEVRAYRDERVPLPGHKPLWPQNVRVDGKPAIVTSDGNGTPQLHLSAGTHRVTGEFLFDELPESIPLPRQVGLVAVSVNGRTLAQPLIDAEGELF